MRVGISGVCGAQGWYVCLQSGSDWPKIGKIQGFFRSDFSAFGAGAPNALESDLKKSRICPIWGQSDPLWRQTYHPCDDYCSLVECVCLSLSEIMNSNQLVNETFIQRYLKELNLAWTPGHKDNCVILFP